MHRRIILFDLDWTLVYTGGAGVRALNHAFQSVMQISEAMKKITPDGKTDQAIIREMIQVHLQRDALPGEIQTLSQAYVQRLKIEVATGPGYRIMPGIPELLETLVKMPNLALGLGTGNLKEGAQAKLAQAQLWNYFSFGGFADDSEDRPTLLAAGVKRGEQRLGQSIPARDVVVIGDTPRDVQAGRAIGATTVAVATGPMKAEDLAKHQPDFLFQDLSDTKEVLKRLELSSRHRDNVSLH